MDFNFALKKLAGIVGRGSENKTPFVAAVEANEQAPLQAVFSKVQSAIRYVSPHSVVVSDGLPCFRAVTAPNTGKAAKDRTSAKAANTINLL